MKNIELKIGTLNDVYPFMVKEFPQNELKKYEVFENLVEKGQYDIVLAYDEKLVGYAFVLRVEATKKLWLDFIAILPEFQSMGYGSLFFNELFKRYQPTYTGMFFEVEIPENNAVNQLRRVQYYTRLGAEILPVNYALPTYEGPFPMYLMYLGETLEQIKDTVTGAFNYIHYDIEGKDKILEKM